MDEHGTAIPLATATHDGGELGPLTLTLRFPLTLTLTLTLHIRPRT